VADQFAKGGPRDLWQALANGGLAALIALVYGLTQDGKHALLFAFVVRWRKPMQIHGRPSWAS